MSSLNKSIINKEELEKIQKESESQQRPDQKNVISVSPKLGKRLHNLPDPTNPPLGYDDHKAFDRVFPYINIPALHPKNHGDTVVFNDTESQANKLYLGDNLEVLRTLPSNSIDLIYIDPPFFSGRNYNVIWGDSNEVRTFEDIWEGGINSYLIWLNARLWEMRRVLKNTGSIYVHCDWHAS
ncbi:MAG: DNA methyltransferase, partial [Candidatus Daviesbacteria bacterium]|nr:DNA methyltransferase [Candidatus Daviesbacteria bacterium]